MRAETVTRYVGEKVGPLDWAYDFHQHCWGEGRGGYNPDIMDGAIARLRTLAANPDKYEATTDGGWPRCGWGKVLDVGMYDGWPYWKPTPSVLIGGAFGAEWCSFVRVIDIRPARGEG